MAHDLIIRGGTLVDGTGTEPIIGDLSVDGDTITAVGKVSQDAKRVIDAEGLIVTPGFIDAHTHLDAQIAWDHMVTPSSQHGVTTVLLGNCGVTFAPCREEHREFLAGMMETVEDIPAHAIMSGLPWDWSQYGDYLDSITRSNPAINFTGLVGHCAVRYYVMGARAVDELATDEEIEEMASLVDLAMKAGAVGFSTSRVSAHRIPDGRPVPGTFSSEEELCRMAEVVRDNGGGLMQTVLGIEGDADKVCNLLRKIAAVGGNRVMTNTSVGRQDQDGQIMHERFAAMNAEGYDVVGGCIPRGSGFICGLCNELPVRTPAWNRLRTLSFEERLAAINDPAACRELKDEAIAVTENKSPEGAFMNTPKGLYWLGDGEQPEWSGGPETSLFAMAEEAGEHPVDTFLRISRETNGKAIFVFRVFNGNQASLTDWMKSPYCLPGLGDAGAHVGQVMDASWSTHVLGHWTRDAGVYSLPEGIRRMTSEPARVIGIKDRGVLKAGQKADVNVIDYEKVGQLQPEYVFDFPNNAGRYTQPGCGFRATICNGEIILENDQHTGARPGRAIRHGVAS
ncbi:MAG: amidohydrolase family protein [Pseudomonadota bacterium]